MENPWNNKYLGEVTRSNGRISNIRIETIVVFD